MHATMHRSPGGAARIPLAAATLACLALGAAPAAGQTPASTDRLARAANGRTTVFVTDRFGTTTKGRLTTLTPDAVVIASGGTPRTVPLSDIRRIERRDPVGDGALIGGFAALALFLGGTHVADGEPVTGISIAVGAYVFGVGAGLGALVDVAIARRVLLYEAPPGPGASGSGRRPAARPPVVRLVWRF